MPPDPVTKTALGIKAGAWVWDKFGKSLTSKAFGAAKDKWDESRWKTASEAYRRKVIELYDSMQIMGMAKPVPLDNIFTEAYMLDKPTAFGRFDIERLKQLSSSDPETPPQAERINGLRLVTEKDNLFILGKPGAGKTTFLKYIALKAAEKTIDKVPIFISLKEWSDSGLELLAFMAERFDICDFPDAQPFVKELLKSGTAIVLFDGLDEVNQESGQRDKQTREMNKYIRKYNRTQYLITCRIAATDYTFEPFDYVEIADFTENQIKTFVNNWFRNKEGKKDEDTIKRFFTEFERDDNKGLRDLARTPLLLTLLCLAFNETLTFPQRRAEIYQEAVDALLKKWDSSRRIKRDEVYRKLSLGHKENMLAQIAAETFERNEYFIPQQELERLITKYVKNVPPHDTNEETDGEAILKAIEAQHGIFVERAHKVYSFSHLTFQEYFTAKYIAANWTRRTLANLVKAHWTDKRWREVFLLTTSLLPDATQLMVIIRDEIDELLCGDEKLKKLLAWINKKSTPIKGDSWVIRLSTLFVELYYQKSMSAFDSALLHAVNIDHTLDHALDMAINLISCLASDYDKGRAQEQAVDLALGIAYNYSTVLLDNNDINEMIKTLEQARTLSSALGLEKLEEELSALLITNTVSPTHWLELRNKIRTLMIKHRNVGHDWKLNKEQETRLADYLNATILLQDCLELATMPPEEKKVMLESLYLPPAKAEEV